MVNVEYLFHLYYMKWKELRIAIFIKPSTFEYC